MFTYLANNPGSNINDWTMNRLPVAFPDVGALPKSAVGYSSNNQFSTFPPLMNDGRAVVSSWYPDSRVSNQIVEENGIRTNWQYRKYMMQNAKELMERNYREAANDTGHLDSMARANESNFTFMEPHRIKYGTPILNSAPSSFMGVEQSDLKQLYLSREELNRAKQPVVLTQAEMLQLRGRA